MSRLSCFLLAIALLSTVGEVHAGTIYTMSEQVGQNPDNIQLSVEGESLRMDQSGDNATIFKGGAERILAVDHGRKSYMVIDRESIAQTLEQLNPALERMRQQLESMAPDQRALVEKMMGRNLPPKESAPQRWEVASTGETGAQAGIDCEWHTVSVDDQLTQRLCMADPDKVTGGRAALANMRAMAQFFDEVFSEVRKQLPFTMPDNPMSNMHKLDGFPIITQQLSDGVVNSDLRLESAETMAIDTGTFEAPEGYTQQKIGTR